MYGMLNLWSLDYISACRFILNFGLIFFPATPKFLHVGDLSTLVVAQVIEKMGKRMDIAGM